MSYPAPALSEEEQAFLDGPCEELCKMLDDWEVCQNLVDYLNEHKTRNVTDDALATVVSEVVNNPFPQMIFLWDGFETDQKLVLAALAETLADSEEHASVVGLTDSAE